MQIAPEALQAPIPGMSLTQPPREATWENPPELNELSEVAKHYTTKLLEPNVEDALLLALDEGAAVDALTDFLTSSGIMNGIHSLDLASLVNPIVRELIMFVADTANVDYIDSYEEREKRTRLPYREVRTIIKEVFNKNPDIADPEDPELSKVVPKGLMARAPENKPLLDEMPDKPTEENL